MAKRKQDETPEEISAEEQAVADAAQRVTDAKATLAEAQAEHDEAVANHAKAVKATQPVADPAIHIGIDDGKGGYSLLEHPEAKDRAARLNIGGRNHEHVSDGENGVWIYRSM